MWLNEVKNPRGQKFGEKNNVKKDLKWMFLIKIVSRNSSANLYFNHSKTKKEMVEFLNNLWEQKY